MEGSMSSSVSESDSPLKVATLLFATTLVALSGAIVNPVLPAIESAFPSVPNAGTLAQLVSTLTGLIIAIFAPIIGVIVDRYGRKAVLVGSLALYGVGPSLAYVADSLYVILGTRVLLGIAVAGIMVSSTTLIADYYSGKRREKVLGWQGAIMPFGAAVAVIAGGVIADLNWRTAFLTYLVALLVLPAVVRYIDEPDRGDKQQAGSIPTWTELREILSTLPLAFLAALYLIMFAGMIGYNQINVEIPFYLRTVTSVGGLMTGVALAAMMIISGVVTMNFDQIRERFDPVVILVGVFVATGVGFTVTSLTTNYWAIVVGIVIAGTGLGLLLPTTNYWVSARVDEQYRGRALSGVTTTQFLGMFISPIAVAPLIEMFGTGRTFLVLGAVGLVLAGVFGAIAVRNQSSLTEATPAGSDG